MLLTREPAADPDAALLRRVARRDEDAFASLYDRHIAQVYGLALYLTRDRRTAEEATQEAFLALWRTAGSYDAGRGAPLPWLLSIARNRSIDCLRRARRHDRRAEWDEGLADRLAGPEDIEGQAILRDQSRRVRRMLADLPRDQRQVIELAYFHGLTQAEIATRVSAPIGTVKGRMRLGLAKLQHALA